MMSLLLDEVALAALRLADAGVESPRADAELIAASVHNVRRGELHTVPDCKFDARVWAERNVSKYVASDPYTAGRVMLHGGDFADALGELDGTVDLVISNPPYIPVGAYVEPEVSEYDPPAALWSGTDGLDAIRALERTARRLLRPGGLLAVEHGAQQGAAVYWVFPEESGWRDTRNNKDLAGRDRFVTAMWPGEGESA